MDKVTHHRWQERSYESLPQWVRKQWQRGNVLSLPRLLRGKTFFYIRQSLAIYKDYSTPNGGVGQSIIGYRDIFHRKLRYNLRRRCKNYEKLIMDFGVKSEVDCNVARELDEYYETKKADAFRNQGWLDKLAFNLNHGEHVYPQHCNNGCPRYEP